VWRAGRTTLGGEIHREFVDSTFRLRFYRAARRYHRADASLEVSRRAVRLPEPSTLSDPPASFAIPSPSRPCSKDVEPALRAESRHLLYETRTLEAAHRRVVPVEPPEITTCSLGLNEIERLPAVDADEECEAVRN
jgi:hypothetical protein